MWRPLNMHQILSHRHVLHADKVFKISYTRAGPHQPEVPTFVPHLTLSNSATDPVLLWAAWITASFCQSAFPWLLFSVMKFLCQPKDFLCLVLLSFSIHAGSGCWTEPPLFSYIVSLLTLFIVWFECIWFDPRRITEKLHTVVVFWVILGAFHTANDPLFINHAQWIMILATLLARDGNFKQKCYLSYCQISSCTGSQKQHNTMLQDSPNTNITPQYYNYKPHNVNVTWIVVI